MLQRSRDVVLFADDQGKLSKQKQLEMRIAVGGHLRMQQLLVCGRVDAGEMPGLGYVGVNLWEINDESQSAEGFVQKRVLKLNVRGLNEFGMQCFVICLEQEQRFTRRDTERWTDEKNELHQVNTNSKTIQCLYEQTTPTVYTQAVLKQILYE